MNKALQILFDLFKIVSDWESSSPNLAKDVQTLLTDLGLSIPIAAKSGKTATPKGSVHWWNLINDAWVIYGDLQTGSASLQADVQKFISDLGL